MSRFELIHYGESPCISNPFQESQDVHVVVILAARQARPGKGDTHQGGSPA